MGKRFQKDILQSADMLDPGWIQCGLSHVPAFFSTMCEFLLAQARQDLGRAAGATHGKPHHGRKLAKKFDFEIILWASVCTPPLSSKRLLEKYFLVPARFIDKSCIIE